MLQSGGGTYVLFLVASHSFSQILKLYIFETSHAVLDFI